MKSKEFITQTKSVQERQNMIINISASVNRENFYNIRLASSHRLRWCLVDHCGNFQLYSSECNKIFRRRALYTYMYAGYLYFKVFHIF